MTYLFYLFVPLLFGLDDIIIILIASAVVGGISTAISRSNNNRDTIAAEQRAMNYGLSRSEKEQNAFNAAEAEKARAWQEDFYNQYQSPSAMVRQYSEAGLNPALMYESGASSPSAISSPQASGSGGASIGQSMSGIASMISALSQARLSNAQAQNLLSKTNTEVINQSTLNKRNQASLDATLAQVKKLGAETEKVDSETALNSILGEKYAAQIADIYKGIDLKEVQIDLTSAQADVTKIQKLIQDNELEIQKAIKDSRIKFAGANANEMAFRAAYESVKARFAAEYGSELPNNQIVGTAAALTNSLTHGVIPDVKAFIDDKKGLVIETVSNAASGVKKAFSKSDAWLYKQRDRFKSFLKRKGILRH